MTLLVGSTFHMTRKIVSEMTYNVSMGTLNPTIPYRIIALGSGQRLLHRLGSGLGLVLVLILPYSVEVNILNVSCVTDCAPCFELVRHRKYSERAIFTASCRHWRVSLKHDGTDGTVKMANLPVPSVCGRRDRLSRLSVTDGSACPVCHRQTGQADDC